MDDLPEPLIRSKPDPITKENTWEEDQELLGDLALARELNKATKRNAEVGRAARAKIVKSLFDDGEEKMRKAGEKLKAEMDAAVPRMQREADQRTLEAQAQLEMQIDRVIANFTSNTASLGGEALPPPPAAGSRKTPVGSVFGLGSSTLLSPSGLSSYGQERLVLVGSEGELGSSLSSKLNSWLERSSSSAPSKVACLTTEDVRLQLSKQDVKNMLATCTRLLVVPDAKAGSAGGGGGWGILGGGAPSLKESNVQALLSLCGPTLQHVICLSSIGCNRPGENPLANLGGALDEKRSVEQEIIRASSNMGFDYTIVRVGKMNSGSLPSGLLMEHGDAPLNGETPRALAEEAILQSLTQFGARNASFSLVGAEGVSPVNQATWDDQFLRLIGPELLRVPISALEMTTAAGAFSLIRDWAQRWMRPSSGLTTPVKVLTPDDRTVDILFVPPKSTYVSAQEEKEAEKRREKGAGGAGGSGAFRGSSDTRQGGLSFLIEENVPGGGETRVRIIRAERGPGVTLKEMSEAAILRKFKEDLDRVSGK